MKPSGIPRRRKPIARGGQPRRAEPDTGYPSAPRSLPRGRLPRARNPLPRSEPPKRTGSRRKKSGGRARPDEPLATWCEARTEACTGRAEVRHHRRGRGKPGDDDREHTLDACDACHRWIHAHPAASYERGWMLRRVP